MLSEDPTLQDGFRSSLFGFDKDDVLAYINALTDQAKQREDEYEEQINSLKQQLATARSGGVIPGENTQRLESLLAQAQARADQAERRNKELDTRRIRLESQISTFRAQCTDRDKAIMMLKARNEEQQQQIEALQNNLKTASQPVAPVAPAKVGGSLSAPPEKPADKTTAAGATVEARRILTDAKLTAENARKEMERTAAEQKLRMAENARNIEVGAQVMRQRLARADQKIAAVSLELENATSAVYDALDSTLKDISALREGMDAYAAGAPETDLPQAESAAETQRTAPRMRAKVRPRSGNTYPSKATAEHRLRRTAAGAAAVDESLDEALGRLNGVQ